MTRKLDALVAERVMGWTWWKFTTPNGLSFSMQIEPNRMWQIDSYFAAEQCDGPLKDDKDAAPHYSSDIAAAWQVIEKMQQMGGRPSHVFRGTMIAQGWIDTSEEVARRICIAALYAVGVDEAEIQAALEES